MIFHSPELHNIPLNAAGKDTHPHPSLTTAPEETAHRRPGTVQSTPNIFALAHRHAPKQRVRRGSTHASDPNPNTTAPTHKHGYESDSTLALLTSGRRTFPSPPLSPKLAPAANIEQLLETREHRVSKALRVQPVWPDNMRTRQYSRQVRVFLGEYRALRRARPAEAQTQTHTPTATPAPRNTATKHTHGSPALPSDGPRTRRRSSTHGKRPAAEQWQVPLSPSHKRAVAQPAASPRPRPRPRPRPKAKAPPLKTHAHSNARPQASALAHAAHLASAEVVSRVPMYVPRESWAKLPDYAPGTENIPRDRVDALRVEWHGAPTDLSQDPLRALLHPAELALAQSLRLPCDLYLDSKRRLFLEKVYRMRRGMPFRRTDAQKACRIDVNKASRLFAAFERVGWLNDANFAKYL